MNYNLRSRLILIIVLFAATLNAWAQPFNPAEAKVISAPNELMTHASTIVAQQDGTLFIAYLRDTTQTHEVSSATTISPVLMKTHFPEMDSFEKVEICKLAYDVESLTNIYDRKIVPFDSKSTFAMFEEMGIRSVFTNDVIMSTRFQNYKGAWYTGLGNAFPKHSKPVIIKTTDGIHYITFSEDRRQLNIEMTRSDIGFVKVKF